MIKDILAYTIERLSGNEYSCDRCSDLGFPQMTIGIIDYIKNHNERGRYCQWCWNYIHLGHYNCECGSHSTLRSSHQTTMVCNDCYKLLPKTIIFQ